MSAEPPEFRPISAPLNVPVFNLVIHVCQVAEGVQARVVNLPDLRFSASSEPQALKQAIGEAKRRLAQWHAAGEAVPWVKTVPQPGDGEQVRLVPVHL